MNILLTSVGRRGYLVDYFKDANTHGKVFVSNSSYTFPMKKADGYFISPLIYEDNYVDALINFCIENKIEALISLFDIDLMVLSKHQRRFNDNNITLILAPYESIEICNDKWKTFNFFKVNGFETPQSFIELDKAILALKNKEIRFPLILKPRWGMASLNVFQANNPLELEVFFNKINEDVFNSYLKYESSITKGANVIIQQKVEGQEYGIDILNDLSSEYVETFAKKKVVMRAGETDLGETVENDNFINITKTISKLIKHQGILSLDCFQTKDGIFLIEMNCRISGHYPVSHCAGVNVPKQIIDWLEGKETNINYLQLKKNVFVCKELNPIVLDAK